MTVLDKGTRNPDLQRLNDVWIEDAIQTAVSRLRALGERAMEQHISQNRHPEGTVPKPGPSHPLHALAFRFTETGFEDGIDRWDWEDVDRVWRWVENREDLQHPLAVFVPVLMMKALRQSLDEDYKEFAEDMDKILSGIERRWNEGLAESIFGQAWSSMASDE